MATPFFGHDHSFVVDLGVALREKLGVACFHVLCGRFAPVHDFQGYATISAVGCGNVVLEFADWAEFPGDGFHLIHFRELW